NSIMAEDQNVYVFEVDRVATKTDVKKAVEKFFRVKVVSVRTSICRSRTSRTRTKVKYWKKAMVKLAPGEKISIFEGA
ncbi:MAG: 50S ribosomal protein L23, partial [Bdellovibrionales bacterium]|nr:50S ribosomal protein L23 [Bdellovibrionales bacterium]